MDNNAKILSSSKKTSERSSSSSSSSENIEQNVGNFIEVDNRLINQKAFVQEQAKNSRQTFYSQMMTNFTKNKKSRAIIPSPVAATKINLFKKPNVVIFENPSPTRKVDDEEQPAQIKVEKWVEHHLSGDNNNQFNKLHSESKSSLLD